MSHDRNLQQALDELDSARTRLENVLEQDGTWRDLVKAKARRVGDGAKKQPGLGKRQLRRKLHAESPAYRAHQRLVEAIRLLRQISIEEADENPPPPDHTTAPRDPKRKRSPDAQAKPRVKIKAVSRSVSTEVTNPANPRTLSAMLADAGFHDSGEFAEQPAEQGVRRPATAHDDASQPDAQELPALNSSSSPGTLPVALSTRLKRAAHEESADPREGFTAFRGMIEEAEVEIFRPSEETAGAGCRSGPAEAS